MLTTTTNRIYEESGMKWVHRSISERKQRISDSFESFGYLVMVIGTPIVFYLDMKSLPNNNQHSYHPPAIIQSIDVENTNY